MWGRRCFMCGLLRGRGNVRVSVRVRVRVRARARGSGRGRGRVMVWLRWGERVGLLNEWAPTEGGLDVLRAGLQRG